MLKTKTCFFAIFMLVLYLNVLAQPSDSTRKPTVFSGSAGITNNGFSIVPTFSLNAPAVIALLSLRKNKFSFEPDVRLTFDARKGGMLFWFRYRLAEGKKFSLRAGIHPALNFQIRKITENGVTTEITQMRRFIAGELAPNYHITPDWTVGIYYLQGNGLQKDGSQTTHFVTFNTRISNINVGGNFRFMFNPSVYYLNLDGYGGKYFTATAELSHLKLPFKLQSTINKTFTSDLPGNKDFMWNVTLNYHFSKNFMKVR
jgi:hypothetical protein